MLAPFILGFITYFTATVFLILCATYLWFQWTFTYWARKGIPGPTPSFPGGNITSVLMKKKQLFQPFVENYFKYKKLPFVGMYTLYNPVIMVNDLNLAKNVLVKDFNHFNSHGTIVCEKFDPLSSHIFNLHGEKWRKLRQNFSPLFSTAKAKSMLNHLLSVAEDFHCHVDKATESGETEDMSHSFSMFTLEVIGRVAFGVEYNIFKEPDSVYLKHCMEFFQPSTFFWKIMRTIWFLAPELFRRLRTPRIKPETTHFFVNLVKETVAHRETNNVERNDFLQMLIHIKNNALRDDQGNLIDNNSESGMTWTQMAAHSIAFLAAGYESSSSTAAFAIYELALNKDVLDKTRDEIFKVLDKHDGQITYEGLLEMEYLTLVIEETLRKYPPMRTLFRRCGKNYHIPGTKVIIDEGTWVLIPIQGFQNDPDIFPEPEKFKPERFLPENKTAKQIASYMPFGDGPKMCLGVRFGMMAAKVALVSFLTRYEFTLTKPTPVPMVFSKTYFSLAPDPGVFVHVTPFHRHAK